MIATTTRTCTLDDCDLPHVARGYCNGHYQRWYKYGDPLAVGRGPQQTASDRFWSRVVGGDMDSCWIWQGATNAAGYGRFFDHRDHQAHRWAYENMRAPIPAGLEIDHLCRTRACVNPWHLEPVTGRVNRQRTSVAMATHCQRNHEFTPDNTYRKPKRQTRECIQCRALNRRS